MQRDSVGYNKRKAASHFRRAREYEERANACFGAHDTVNLDSKEGDGLLDATGLIKVVYEGAAIPCTVTRSAGEIGLVVAGDSGECLKFSVYTGKGHAVVYILDVATPVCPVPDVQHKGAFLLLFVEEICRQVGVRTVMLTDASTIPCGEASVDLQFLSIIRHGRSWYERRGFSYQNASNKHNISAIAKSSLDEICRSLSSLDAGRQRMLKEAWLAEDIASFKESFPEFRDEGYASSVSKKPHKERSLKERLFVRVINADYGFSMLSSKAARMCELARRYKSEGNGDSLGGFLSHLWSSGMCTEYVEAMSVLYPDEAKVRAYIDPGILPRYVRGDTSMIKHLW